MGHKFKLSVTQEKILTTSLYYLKQNITTMSRPTRLQGTDGIRATTALGADLPGVSPVDAFLVKGLLTEQFVELYCYCFCKWSEGIKTEMEDEIIIGWDPRDPQGNFTDAAVRGVQRSGAAAVVIGIAATPLISMYQQHSKSRGAIVISASHNFRTQNGIKLFLGKTGMKLLPEQDVELTAKIYSTDFNSLPPIPKDNLIRDESSEATNLFIDFHTMTENTWDWVNPRIRDNLLVVDSANGAMSGVAAKVFKKLFKNTAIEIIEVNSDVKSGAVNVNGGVADLEGTEIITRDDPSFKKHAAAKALFSAKRGVACCFDADGDRYYGLVYDAATDQIFVISGDEAAMHQAAFLMKTRNLKSPLFTYTVESDLQAGTAAIKLGFTPKLTAVGDKWLLSTAHGQGNFSVACESSGHSITRGFLPSSMKVFYSGNGLKAAINTLRSVEDIPSTELLAHPFSSGLKKTLYVFYTNKRLLPSLLPELQKVLADKLQGEGVFVKRVVFPEEPEMLYMGVYEDEECSRQRSAIFIRNSGTEDKTGINIRGPLCDQRHLVSVGEQMKEKLYKQLKNYNHPMTIEESQLLAGKKPYTSGSERVLKEMTKGGLLKLTDNGHVITKFGEMCAGLTRANL